MLFAFIRASDSPIPSEEPVRKRTRRRISSDSTEDAQQNLVLQKPVEQVLNLEISDKSLSESPEPEPYATSSPYPSAASMPDGKSSKSPTSAVGEPPADHEPPELQVMVSETELWLINERNNKQKHDENNLSSCDKETSRRMDVVITDVRAHDYSVIIKECYNPSGFFRSTR